MAYKGKSCRQIRVLLSNEQYGAVVELSKTLFAGNESASIRFLASLGARTLAKNKERYKAILAPFSNDTNPRLTRRSKRLVKSMGNLLPPEHGETSPVIYGNDVDDYQACRDNGSNPV